MAGFGRSLGIVIALLVTATFFVFDAFGVQQFYLPLADQKVPWPIPTTLSFLAFLSLVANLIHSYQLRIATIEDQHPVIHVAVATSPYHEMALEVSNTGARAEFEAQIDCSEKAERGSRESIVRHCPITRASGN
jgi:hypothetical protein